ncbi:uncharacterized protein [Dermacentor albipictus]|uniref:uncharacterized protein isoform X2 n=1 Tax=Dermacentor albipictus TaxID=60249 RepID=UPI0031FC0ADE
MAVPENGRAGQQPDGPKYPHASTLFVTALTHQQPPGRGNVAAAGRRASVPTLAAASHNRRHSKRQHDDVPRPTGTPQQRRAAFTTRSVQPSGALPQTLEKTVLDDSYGIDEPVYQQLMASCEIRGPETPATSLDGNYDTGRRQPLWLEIIVVEREDQATARRATVVNASEDGKKRRQYKKARKAVS